MTYLYQRQDGTRFEFEQRITDEPLKICPTTGQVVKRVIQTPLRVFFKGPGFYETDYKGK